MSIISFLEKKEDKKISKIKNEKKSINDDFIEIVRECTKHSIIDLAEFKFMMDFVLNCSISNLKVFKKINKKILKSKYGKEYSYILKTRFSNIIFEEEDKIKYVNKNNIVNNFKKNVNLKLSNDQEKASKKILKFLLSSSSKCFGLYGFAGTGKTTLIITLVNYLLNNNLINSVAFTAPTNKAVNVMKAKFRAELKFLMESKLKSYDENEHFDKQLSKLKKIGLNIDFITVHRLLNYQTEFNNEGERIYTKGKGNSIYNYDVVFIDECSMIQTDIYYNLFNDINKSQINKTPKIVFVGDPAQLPPVEEDNSLIFKKNINFKYFVDIFSKKNEENGVVEDVEDIFKNLKKELNELETYTLKEVLRSDDDNVIGLCNNIRQYVMGNIKNPVMGKYKGKHVKIFNSKNSNYKHKTDWFSDYMKILNNKNQSTIILTWTNRQTDLYNEEVRRNLKINCSKKYNIGDTLILNDFYNFDEVEDKTDNQHFYTSEQIKVMDVHELDFKTNNFVCFLKDLRKFSNFRVIESKYKSCIERMNQNTKRKYKVYKLLCKSILSSSDKTKNIYVIKDEDKERLETDKQFCINEIKTLRQYLTILYENETIAIDNHVIKPLWEEMNSIFIEPFANVNLGSSITCHRAQGSTFHNVFVDADDILNNNKINEAKRCIYTALTRTSKSVFIII